MQRWSFPSFRLHIGNSSPTHSPINLTPSRSPSPQMPQSAGNQAYSPSAKYINMESTLRSRITKQKAKNDQMRKTIANLEAKSAYLHRLKELEKEVAQLEKEGRELARRETEIKRVAERETTELEVNEGNGDGAMTVKKEKEGEDWDRHRVWQADMEERRAYEKVIRGDTSIGAKSRLAGEMAKEIEKAMREGIEATYREAKTVKERKREGRERLLRQRESQQRAEHGRVERAWAIEREDQAVNQKHQDSHGVKQESQVAVKDEAIEEIELLNGAAAWSWSDSPLVEEINGREMTI